MLLSQREKAKSALVAVANPSEEYRKEYEEYLDTTQAHTKNLVDSFEALKQDVLARAFKEWERKNK